MNPHVDVLRARLRSLEQERRFNGEAYPDGLCPFPFHLTGQGFFPGGDGLWRDDAELARLSAGLLPVDGGVFVGNDFGTLSRYKRLERNSYENPPTWWRLKKRIRLASLPERNLFFTNAILGLRSKQQARALDAAIWHKNELFVDLCRAFFVLEVELIRPRLIVALGPVAKSALLIFADSAHSQAENLVWATFGSHTSFCFFMSHPYADFNFSEDRKCSDALSLRDAWQSATAVSTSRLK